MNPAGDAGFEGLVAYALAAFSGLTIRLAKSGLQYGRDGSSPAGPFAIAMEAKRHDEPPRLESLAGKVLVGAHVLQDDVDLYVLAATCEIGDATQRELTAILQNYGVTLLTLDWATRPIPPLGLLLAATNDETRKWFRKYSPDSNWRRIATQLAAIRKLPPYNEQLERLREQVSSATVGLDALRQRNTDWLHKRFENRERSRSAFGQFIDVQNARRPATGRSCLQDELATLCKPELVNSTVIAVLGEEGSGKTWLIAQWWARLSEKRVTLFVAGRRVEELVAGKPEESIARLIASEQSAVDEMAVRSWQRRLQRWKGAAAEHLRFVVVLDGINEHSLKPWADLIVDLIDEVRALGGVVIITSRSAFWSREVSPRLPSNLIVEKVIVGNFSDEELGDALSKAGVSEQGLSGQVREFIKNPRVCSVAINLIHRLTLQSDDLTVDRLLLEYWRARLEERGDPLKHTPADIDKLLRSHAKDWSDKLERSFDRDHWADHSGAAKRDGLQHVRNDLTEIEEGRFFYISDANPGYYSFRNEALPYALALLVTDELRQSLEKKTRNPNDLLNDILDPLRGFERIGEILAASTGLACLDSQFPPNGREALLRAFLNTQNLTDPAVESIGAYVSSCPELFLGALEWRGERTTHHELFLDVAVSKRNHPALQKTVDERLPKWLGRWSKQSSDSSIEYREDRCARIEKNMQQLSPAELAMFRGLTAAEESDNPHLQLDYVAVMFVAGRPLAPYVTNFLGWALARAVASDYGDSYREMEWLLRLNSVDWLETKQECLAAIATINAHSAEPLRRAAAILLGLLGDKSSSDLADQLYVRKHYSEKWRFSDRYCETNPHDPTAEAGVNLQNARSEAEACDPMSVWSSLSRTLDDSRLESLTPALARFEPDTIVKFHRSFAMTGSAPNRLRALALQSWSRGVVSASGGSRAAGSSCGLRLTVFQGESAFRTES